MHRLNPYYIYIFYYMVYRVYRVYGYFQKSIYGIYFTFPIIRSGGWEMDLLYRVLETLKKPDLPTTAPPCPSHPCVGVPHPLHFASRHGVWNSLGVLPKIAFWRDFVCTPIYTTWVPIKSLWESFKCLLRDFWFGDNFLGFPNLKNLFTKNALKRIKRKRGDWTPQSNRLNWSSRVVLE